MLELRHLNIVVAATDNGSFSAAARKLNIEVSAVSRTIREVEDYLGIAIFERLPRGVRLTGAGLSYVASARDILARYSRANLDARLAGAGRPLHLTIGFPWSASCKPMIALLRSFAIELPTAAVELVEAGNDELVDRVRSRQLDVAIAEIEPPPLRSIEGSGPLSIVPLWREPLELVVPSGLEYRSLTWSDLSKARLLSRSIDDSPRFAQHLLRLGGPKLTFEPHAVSQEGLLGLVAAGMGWTLIPASLRHLLPDDVRAVTIESEGATLAFGAVSQPSNANEALSCFLELCRQLYAPELSDVTLRSLDPSP